MNTYKIIDGQTGNQIGGIYHSRSRAMHRANRLDNEYGAHRYSVRIIWGE